MNAATINRVAGRVWDPWREIAHLQREVSRMFNGNRPGFSVTSREYPPVNVYTGENSLVLTMEAPGLDADKLDITVTTDTVTIKAERPSDEPQAGGNFHRRERPVGQFVRSLQLPCAVDPSRTEANYDKGTIVVKLARPEEAKPKKVTIKPA